MRVSNSCLVTVTESPFKPAGGCHSKELQLERATFTSSASLTRILSSGVFFPEREGPIFLLRSSIRAQSRSRPPGKASPTLSRTCQAFPSRSTTARSTVPAPQSRMRDLPENPKARAAATGSFTIRTDENPALRAAEFIAERAAKVKDEGTVRTHRERRVPRKTSPSSRSIVSSGTRSSSAGREREPHRALQDEATFRLMSHHVDRGFRISSRAASSPARHPSFDQLTTEGVLNPPHRLGTGITPLSSRWTAVWAHRVPRSIPRVTVMAQGSPLNSPLRFRK